MDAAGAFKTVLENLGYTNVKIERSELPDHVAEWARGDDSELTDDELAEVMPYFTATSEQGTFGIAMAAYNLIDTKLSGCTARELGDTEAPEDSFLISLNAITLQRLKRLMTSIKH